MNTKRCLALAAVVLVSAGSLSQGPLARSAPPGDVGQPPARNANIWDGRAHQPTRANVRSEEILHGVRANSSYRAALDQQISSLCRTLLRGAATGRGC